MATQPPHAQSVQKKKKKKKKNKKFKKRSLPVKWPDSQVKDWHVPFEKIQWLSLLKRSETSFILWAVLKNTDKVCAKFRTQSMIIDVPVVIV